MPAADPAYCPRCGTSFQGDAIPEEDRENYGGLTHFSRVVGIYDVTVDRTVAWQCPDCGHTWKEVPQQDRPSDPGTES